jgi:hypothetical protein
MLRLREKVLGTFRMALTLVVEVQVCGALALAAGVLAGAAGCVHVKARAVEDEVSAVVEGRAYNWSITGDEFTLHESLRLPTIHYPK